MAAKNISWKPLVGYGTRLCAVERNVTLWPSPLIAGTMLLPSEGGGALPAGWLARVVLVVQLVVLVMFKQLLRTKMFSMPFEILSPKFDARDENAMNWPVAQADNPVHRLIVGCSFRAFAGVVPSEVETRIVEGAVQVTIVLAPVQVSRT